MEKSIDDYRVVEQIDGFVVQKKKELQKQEMVFCIGVILRKQ